MCKASGVIGLGTPKNALVYQTSLGWRLVQERVALVYETTLGGCLVHQEVISGTKLSCDDTWHTRRAFCVRIVCGNTFIKRIITSSLMASEHIQASIFIRNRGERFVRYSLISYICQGELVIIWK